jgi:hypothetical protein
MGMSTFQRDVLALNDETVDESKRYRTRSRLTKRRSRDRTKGTSVITGITWRGDINHALSVQVMIFVTVITYTTAIL